MMKPRASFSLIFAFLFFLISGLNELAAKDVRVKGYFRKDGAYVSPHYRSAPDGNKFNNWSTRGNVNPYTGKVGTKDPYKHYGNSSYSSSSSSLDTNFYIKPNNDLSLKSVGNGYRAIFASLLFAPISDASLLKAKGKLKRNAKTVEDLVNNGIVYISKAKIPEALLTFKEALKEQPDYKDAQFGFAACCVLRKLSGSNECIKSFEEIFTRNNTNLESLAALGSGYALIGINQLSSLEDVDNLVLNAAFGNVIEAQAQTNLKKAFQNLAKFNKLKPDSPYINLLLAKISLLSKKSDRSATLFLEKELVNNPDSALTIYELANLNIKTGDRDKALSYYSRLKNMDPSLAEEIFNKIYN